MQKISPFLWFDNQAEEAANYYVSIFKDSKILDVSRYGEGAPLPAGTVMGVTFVLDGAEFQALNGGPQYSFTEAISLFVRAETQDEIDDLWDKLTADGEPGPCGWLKDKYGLSADPGGVAGRSGPRQGRRGDASHDGDGQARHRRVAWRIQRGGVVQSGRSVAVNAPVCH